MDAPRSLDAERFVLGSDAGRTEPELTRITLFGELPHTTIERLMLID